ncbi:MAG TPA: hypothetical protein VFI09_07085 [Solirubrobacterales bacterium]|nr:hypothetical protein [Solirubrobacterales bacterium]
MADEKTKRRCTARTKAGAQCRNGALPGQLVCLSHADRKIKKSAGFGGAQPGSGRPRKLKPAEVEQRLMENYAIAWMRPYWKILGFDVHIDDDGELVLTERPEGGAKLYGTSAKDGTVCVSEHEDLGAQMAAAEKLRDRVFGRPKSMSEFKGEVTHRNAEKIDREVERLTERLTEKALADRDGEPAPS